LRNQPEWEVCGEAADGREAVVRVLSLKPDVVIMDIGMPNLNGLEATRQITKESLKCKVIILSSYSDDEYVQQLTDAGASGYLAKDATPADLCDAAAALAGGTRNLVGALEPAAPRTRSAGSSAVLAVLSPRELEVLRALATDAGNDVIARHLGISGKTLRNHIRSTYHQLGIYDRAHAVIVAVREGLVDVTPRHPA